MAERDLKEAQPAKLLQMLADEQDESGYAFTHHFARHLFFDLDVRFDNDAVSALKEVVQCFSNPSERMAVFSLSERRFLDWLQVGDAWHERISALSERLEQSGIYGGLVLLDEAGKFAIYQERPVDLGVLAFDGPLDWSKLSTNTREALIRPVDIQQWLAGNTERDAALAKQFGHDFLHGLIRNYG